jgi:Plavaka transposase
MDWAHFAQYSKYTFSSAPVFHTALHQMHTKYANVSGGPPISEIIITVPSYQPMHVYRFNFLQQAECLFSDSELMKDSLWDYDCSVSSSGERLFSELNTGNFWHLGVEYVSQRASLPTTDKVLPHIFCPVILFIDSTLADRIGWLKIEPVICSFGNICGEKRRLASSWFILGFIHLYPKSSVEAAADRAKVKSKHDQIVYYHQCLKSILQDLLAADNNPDGQEMFIPSLGTKIRAHFKLSLVIGDTEGHDKVCTHYCSYSSNIQPVSRDCDLSQSKSDDVDANCDFVNMNDIKAIVSEQIAVLNERPWWNIGKARKKL